MVDPARRSPSRETLDWVCRSVDAGSAVVRVRRLMGGISSSVHAVTVERRNGSSQRIVLRRWIGDWVARDPNTGRDLVLAEERALLAAERSALPAPRFIAADPTGENAGGPASLLMTLLPGRVHLSPRNPDAWLRAQAETLPLIHALDGEARVERATPDFSGWEAPRSRRPAIWQAARTTVESPPPATPRVFRHGDYQHFNMLWSHGHLTGIVDWTFPGIGVADLDAGHCRLNLAVLYSADHAERFREFYESAAGRTMEPYWDLVALLKYSDDWAGFIPIQVNGMIPVDTGGMTRRVEDLVSLTLRRLG